MRRPIGITLGTAALGIAGISLAIASHPAPPAMLVSPTASLGAAGDLLGGSTPSAPSKGAAPGWLLMRVLPDQTPAAVSQPAPPAPAPAPVPVVLTSSPAAPAGSGHAGCVAGGCLRVPGVVTVHLPVSLPSPLRIVQHLPLLSGPPPAPIPPPPGHGGHHPGAGHGQDHRGGGSGSAAQGGSQGG